MSLEGKRILLIVSGGIIVLRTSTAVADVEALTHVPG